MDIPAVVMRVPAGLVFLVLLATMALGLFSVGAMIFLGLNPRAVTLSLLVIEVAYGGWLLALGVAMNRTAPEELRLSPYPAAIGLCVAGAYILWLGFGSAPREGWGLWSSALILGFHFSSMLANLYLLWFASRCFVVAKERSDAAIGKIWGYVILLWLTAPIPTGARRVHGEARDLLFGAHA